MQAKESNASVTGFKVITVSEWEFRFLQSLKLPPMQFKQRLFGGQFEPHHG